MPSSPIITKHPAIIATFYGEPEPSDDLAKRLVSLLALEEKSPTEWKHKNTELFLRRFVPLAAPDTVVLQLASSWTSEGIERWDNMRLRLEDIIRDEDLAKMWGYSLIYQAIVETDQWPVEDSSAQDALLNKARPLHAAPTAKVPLLARSSVEGGELWLTHVALKKAGTQAATVYLALSPSEEAERTMVKKVIYGLTAPLLMPDLIAHKSYYLRRQYTQNQIREGYERAADSLHEVTGRLIQQSTTSPNARQLNGLMQEHKSFLAIVQEFDYLYLSLKRQSENYDIWQPRANLGPVLIFHSEHIKTTLTDLELLNQRARNTLEASKTAIDIIQTRLDRENADRQQNAQTWLAIIGTALAVPQIVDREIAERLLRDFTFYAEPTGGYDLLHLMLVQCLITLLCIVVVRLLLWIQE